MKAILTFQGFRESRAKRTGTEDLYFEVIRKMASKDVVTMLPQPWTADVRQIAAQLARQGVDDASIVSYSHGQAAATAFAKEAYKIGVNVSLWLACDPVYRPTWVWRNWLGQFLSFRALLKRGKIKVPSNVMRVSWVRQELNLPCGHTLVATSRDTNVQHPLVLPYVHTEIDRAGRWFDLVHHELEAWIHPPTISRP